MFGLRVDIDVMLQSLALICIEMRDLKTFAEELVNLTRMDVSELAEILKEEYGVEACAAPAASTDKLKPKKRRVAKDDYLLEQENLRRNQMMKEQPDTYLKKGKNQNFRRR